MRLVCSIIALLAWLLMPAAGFAQQRPLLDAARAAAAAAGPQSPAESSQISAEQRDSVANGLFIGIGIGLVAGVARAWVHCQGGTYKGECDDEPGRGPLMIRWGLIGAAAGGVLGWILDLSQSGNNESGRQDMRSGQRMLVVTPVASPSRKAVQLTLRF
jgi:hypothetical protein